jgi:uncharacterized protein with PIN domain
MSKFMIRMMMLEAVFPSCRISKFQTVALARGDSTFADEALHSGCIVESVKILHTSAEKCRQSQASLEEKILEEKIPRYDHRLTGFEVQDSGFRVREEQNQCEKCGPPLRATSPIPVRGMGPLHHGGLAR